MTHDVQHSTARPLQEHLIRAEEQGYRLFAIRGDWPLTPLEQARAGPESERIGARASPASPASGGPGPQLAAPCARKGRWRQNCSTLFSVRAEQLVAYKIFYVFSVLDGAQPKNKSTDPPPFRSVCSIQNPQPCTGSRSLGRCPASRPVRWPGPCGSEHRGARMFETLGPSGQRRRRGSPGGARVGAERATDPVGVVRGYRDGSFDSGPTRREGRVNGVEGKEVEAWDVAAHGRDAGDLAPRGFWSSWMTKVFLDGLAALSFATLLSSGLNTRIQTLVLLIPCSYVLRLTHPNKKTSNTLSPV